MGENNMRLIRAKIYGFGNWMDDTIDFSGHAYICVYGENESGKSTLQQFILFMLFGLPPKMRTYYRPKSSGKMGGRLTVSGDAGEEFTIERLDQVRNGAATCYTPAGGEHDEAWLQDRLKGMTNATYQSIFSFSGLDLSGIKTMKEEDLGEVLLGIGLTGAKNIYAIEKRLDNKIGDLFKRYGKKPAINQQLATLDDLFLQLKKYENEEAAYREKKADIQALSGEIVGLQSSVAKAREERLSLEKQQHALPILKEYHHYTELLSNYPPTLTFPENGLARLNGLKEKLLPLKSELSVVQDNKEKYKAKHTALQQKLYDETVYKQATEIIKEKQAYLDNRREMAKQLAAIKQLETQIDTEANQLNIGLVPTDLATITFPFHTEKTWNELKNNRDQLNAEQEQLDQEEVFLKKQQSELQNQKQEKEAKVLSDQQVNVLTEKINTYDQQHYIEKLQDTKENQRTKWKQVKKQREQRMTSIFIGSIIAAIVLAIIAGVADRLILFSGSAILLLLGIGQYIWGKQSLKMTEQLLYGEEHVTTVHATMEEKESAERLLANDNQHRRALDSIHEQLKTLQIKLIQWEERKLTFETKEKRFTEQMETEVMEYPFLEQVSIRYWPEFFHTMKQLLQMEQQKSAYVAMYQDFEQTQSKIQHQYHMFFETVNREMLNKAMISQMEAIEDLLEDFRDTTGMLKQYEEWITANEAQQRILQQKMRTYDDEIKVLFNIADVDTEEEFLKQAKQLDGKEKISEKGIQLSHQLSMMFSQNAYKAFLEKEAFDEHLLQGSYEQTTAKMNELDKEIEVKRQQLADVKADVSNMETSQTYSNTLHRFTMEQEQLKKLANEWAVLKTAKEMLAETKRNYREKYLSKVLDRTSAYFKAITGDNYTKVYAPAENILFQVEASDEIRYTVNELSQGTIDQLYISLRLAISEVMSEEHRLPFIIDDAFVYFDAIRTKRVMDILSERATHQQIIIFTCKTEVQEAAGDAKVIRLGNTVRVN